MSLALDQCGETLSTAEYIAVLGIQKSKFYELKRHGMVADEVPGCRGRYYRKAIEAHRDAAVNGKRLRRSA